MSVSIPRNTVSPLALLGTMLFLTACVTVNIYFPAAAAEKAADRIIDQVWGTKTDKATDKPTEPKTVPPTSQGPSSFDSKQFAKSVLDFLIPTAAAQSGGQANINVSTPGINQLKNTMASRHASLKGFYTSGAVGLTAEGLVSARDLSAVSLRQRGQVKRLVADENADRSSLYREISRANGHPEWERQIRSTFAQRWIAKARSGWWYQTRSGAWQQK